ncbi:MAG: single-stranded DNA-binding protein [Ardenticatenaceae bacterium]|jgi:single-strand DNA-binding protein|nr:single-stranded DNA-binding protein [Anaerolineales bacterium]MCB8918715.1 single-stranded DNA-binding protein [Ardenticatenaceae bacterium]
MYQKIILIGNLGRDPEMRYMPDGTAVTSFSMATSRRWTDSRTGQPVEETTWFRVSVWGRQAETANQYLSKGSKVLVEGRLKPDPATGSPRLWTRNDGSVGSSFEVTADNVRFLSGREDGGHAGGGEEFEGGAAQEEDDIPF